MKYQNYIFLFLVFSFFQTSLMGQCQDKSEKEACCSAEKCTHVHQHSVAPMGVMYDHCHPKGGLMLSYRYMPMLMEGNLLGATEVEDAAIFENYMLAPQEMTMQMHMVGLMYGLTDRLTLMGMLNYQQNQMNMVAMDQRKHTHESAGFGDFSLNLLTSLWQSEKQNLHAHLGLSFPTGSINLTEVNHLAHQHHHEGGMETPMPYPMRLGSGTYDLFLGTTYSLQIQPFSLGLQASGKLRTSDNQRDYRLGNELDLRAWWAYQPVSWLHFSVGGQGLFRQGISGVDGELMAQMSPTNDTNNSGETRLYTTFGCNWLVSDFWNGLRIGGVYGLPVYQQVEGIQMKQRQFFTLGIQLNLI